MPKQIKQFLTLGLLLCLTLILCTGFAGPARAGKAMKSLALAPSSSTVEVVALYETSYAAQKTVAKALKTSSKLMKKAAGFQGFSLLQSQDGKQVVAFSQWQDLASYQAYTASQPTDSNPPSPSPGLAPPPAPTQVQMFEGATTQTAIAGATPALRGKEAVVQLVEFTTKTPEGRTRVLNHLQTVVPDLLQKQPIPQSMVVLRGVDNGPIALLTNWNCSALFEDVGKPTPFVPDDELVALADSQQQLYNVVTIIPTEAKKEAKADD